MTKISDKKLDKIKAEYEVKGTSAYELCKKYSIPPTTLKATIARNGWVKGSLKEDLLRDSSYTSFIPHDIESEIDLTEVSSPSKKKVTISSNGPKEFSNERKKVESAIYISTIDAFREELSKVLTSHRQIWPGIRDILVESIQDEDFTKAKLAGEQAKAMALIQKHEREAWGIDQVSRITIDGSLKEDTVTTPEEFGQAVTDAFFSMVKTSGAKSEEPVDAEYTNL